MQCPSSLQLYQFAHGTGEQIQREAIAAHVAECPACARGVSEARHPSSADGLPVVSLADALEPREGATVSLAPRIGADSSTVAWDSGSLRTADSSRWTTTDSQIPRGTPIGRYLVVEPLGSGGLGDVYTAYDPELDRCVAIKVLRPSDDPVDGSGNATGAGSGRDRLMREAKALARLSHPNVVAVYDVGRVGEDVFIAMERVEGTTLSRWTRAETRPWREVRDVFLGVGAGVAAAHDAGIVHRDLKPQNVIVSADGRPRVLDFGLARAVRRDERSDRPHLPALPQFPDPKASHDSLDDAITMAGMVMGTPQYMAPEQFAEAETIGPATDQFSFCVALWVALYDQRPFQGEGMEELVRAVRTGEVTPPRERRGVPAWLHKVMLRGMATDPGERFGSMRTLMHAMQRDRRSRRAQFIAAGAVALISAVGAGAAAFVLRPALTDEHRNEVEILAQQAQEAAARSFYVYPSLEDEQAVTAYRKVLELERREGPEEELADERAAQLRVAFSDTLTRLGDRYYEREGGRAFATDYYAAALVFDPDNEHARERTRLTPGELAGLRERAATGEFSAAELSASESLAVLATDDDDERRDKLLALYEGEQAPSVSTSARLEALLGDEEAEVITEAVQRRHRSKRRRSADRPIPESSVFLPVGRAAQSPVAQLLPVSPGREGPGEVEVTEAVEHEDPSEPVRRSPKRARALATEGMSAFRRGDFERSEALFHQALVHDRRNATALGGLAELHFERGSYQKAVQFGSKAVRAAPRRGKYRIVLGDAYFKTLSYQRARREYEKAKALGAASASARLAQLDARLGG